MRGIESRNELNPNQLLRDTRSLGQRIVSFFSDPTNIAIVLFSMAVIAFYFVEVATFLLLLGIIFFYFYLHS